MVNIALSEVEALVSFSVGKYLMSFFFIMS